MTGCIIPDFSGKLLVIPEKDDIERDSVAKAWQEHRGSVIRIGRFWEPPEMRREQVCLYGNHVFCMILAQKLNLRLISPPDDLLINLSRDWLKRNVILSSIAEAEKLCYPCFIKPLVPKVFTAQKYNSYSELLDECTKLGHETPVICSDIVDIKAEVRSFILNGEVCAASMYEGEGDIAAAKDFLTDFIRENASMIPLTCVIDIGFLDGLGWAVIEANASWGAGLNGCDPLAATKCIAVATEMGESLV